jgi:hypothetical protein
MSERIDTSGDDHSVAIWIWRHMVPKSGQSGTVQGELLRAVEKLRWEAQSNGNINRDESHLTPRWSGRVRGKVASSYAGARGAQLNR